MKIGIVSNLYPPYVRGGAEHVVVRTVEELIEQDQDVFVVTSCPKSRSKTLECYRNAAERIYHFFPKNLYFILDDYKHIWPVRLLWHVIDAFHPYSANILRQVIDKERPDAMITHNLKGVGLRIVQAIRAKGIPHVHVVHDLQLIYPSGLLYAGKERIPFVIDVFYKLYRRVCRWLFRSPDVVIFPSKYLEGEYRKYGFFPESKIVVMPNPAPDLPTVDRRVRTEGPLKLLFVGQLEDHKGVPFLLQAMRKLPEETRLIIAGEGTCMAQVSKAAEQSKHITYLGYISIEQLVHCFGVADALVVPSLCYENSPTVIYESLQAGVPVLASDIGGVGELIEDGKNGFLFHPGDVQDFLRVVHTLDAQKKDLAANQEMIKETVAPYALPLYTKKLIQLLDRIAGDR